MADRYMTPTQVAEALRAAQGALSERAFAAKIGIAQQALNDAFRGKRLIPKKALNYLGLEDMGRMYRRKGKA